MRSIRPLCLPRDSCPPLLQGTGRAAALGRFAVALALGLAALVPASGAELVLAVARSPHSLPIHVAEAQGYFAAEGVQVRTRDCVSGQRCIQELLDGQAQLATVADLPIVFHSFERADYAVLATLMTSVRDAKVVARKSSGIGTAAHLAGKRVATPKGSSAHFFLDAYLLINGVDPALVTVVSLPPEQLADALERRQVDAVAVFEPWAWRAVQAAGADALVLPGSRTYTTTFNLLADRHTIAARDDELVRVLRAVERAERFIREQPGVAQSIMISRLQLDRSFVGWAWRDFDYRLGLDQSLISTLENEARWALREGHVKAGKPVPNYLDFLHPVPLRKAVPGAVTIVR